MGIVAVAFLAERVAVGPPGNDYVCAKTHKVRSGLIEIPLWMAVFNGNVPPFHPAQFSQPLLKCFDPHQRKRGSTKKPDPWDFLRPLRVGWTAKRKHYQHNEESKWHWSLR